MITIMPHQNRSAHNRAVDRIDKLNRRIVHCTLCPRLVAWREEVAVRKVARFADWEYWGKPVPGFGDVDAGLLIVGLAPAAHGANRTGRMFTGDRSGDWLFRALKKFGFANQSSSESKDDGLKLQNCYITASVRCAPPDNKPSREEFRNCRRYLLEELRLLPNVSVILGLGKMAFDVGFDATKELKIAALAKRPRFKHGTEVRLSDRLVLIGSYHPSQQNTFTGRLTEKMFDGVFARARRLLEAINDK